MKETRATIEEIRKQLADNEPEEVICSQISEVLSLTIHSLRNNINICILSFHSKWKITGPALGKFINLYSVTTPIISYWHISGFEKKSIKFDKFQ